MEEYATLIKLAFYLVDKLSAFKLTPTVFVFLNKFFHLFFCRVTIKLSKKDKWLKKSRKKTKKKKEKK